MNLRAIIVVVATMGACVSSIASDLGKVGPVYPITEKDMLELIKTRLLEKEKTGELAKLQQEAVKRSMNSIQNPKPVPGLGKTAKARTYYFDPSVTADRNHTDAEGRIVVAAGTRVNPLDYVSLSRHLLFFDARDKAQVARAEALIHHYQGKVKPILTGGSYVDLMRQWKAQVYYDQSGILVRKFGIRHVPALVSQEGRRLRIDEIL
jgi:conjugal transfer pilus assembly protein TraW